MIKNKKAIGNFTRISTYPGELCELLYCSRSTESPASKTLEALEQWKSREGGLNIQRFLPAHIWLTKSYERLYIMILRYILLTNSASRWRKVLQIGQQVSVVT